MKKKLIFPSIALTICMLLVLILYGIFHSPQNAEMTGSVNPQKTESSADSDKSSEAADTAEPENVIRMSELSSQPAEGGKEPNPYSFLNVPTQMTKIGEDYFLVDCYHNQVLTSSDPNVPLTQWLVVTDQINKGHTIAGDGTVYLVDDTENNRILIFEKKEGLFYQTQSFSDIGIRPHYVTYDEQTNRFYALSSMTGELYIFYRYPDSSQVALEKILSIPALDGYYVRSFTIDGDSIYFISGNTTIIKAALSDLSVEETWPVPLEIGSMIQLTKIQDYFYITVSTDAYGDQSYATLLRVSDLNQLASQSWEDIYELFIGGGTPYYISGFDGHYYLTEHRVPGHSVWEFDVIDNEIKNIRAVY